MTDTPQTLLSITQAAKKLRVSQQRVSQWLDEERIPFFLIAGRRVIAAADCRKPKPIKPGPKTA